MVIYHALACRLLGYRTRWVEGTKEPDGPAFIGERCARCGTTLWTVEHARRPPR